MVTARSAVVGGAVTATAAVLGNAFVSKESLSWFRGLQAPRWQLPMPGFVTVAAAYYVIMGVVLARRTTGATPARSAGLSRSWSGTRRGTGCCSVGGVTRAAFVGVLAFLGPLAGLQRSVWPRRARHAGSCWRTRPT